MHGQLIKRAAKDLLAGAFARAMTVQIAQNVELRHKLFP